MKAEVAVVGAGVVGSAAALALARRGVEVVLLEAEAEPGLAASGSNSGILHTGFDSVPGELETELILRAAELRDRLLPRLGVPVRPCGAVLRPREPEQRDAVAALAENAARNGVEVSMRDHGSLEVPGEAITDPLALTHALAAAAVAHGATLHTDFRVAAIEPRGDGFELDSASERVEAAVVVNCAGLFADEVAAMAGADGFEIYPRKGEFLVFEQPPGDPLERILLPVPERGTKGVLVFPTIDGKLIAGPTAVDGEDKGDWSVRPEAREEILPKAIAMHPPLAGREPIAAYAGLRPAGRGLNYLIDASPGYERFVNVAAIRSTGMTASLAIAERVTGLVGSLGVELGPERPLEAVSEPRPAEHWWRRVAGYRGAGR